MNCVQSDDLFSQSESIQIIPYQKIDVNWHTHNYLELVYVMSGHGFHLIDDLEYEVKQGDCFLVDYGSCHKYLTVQEESFEIVTIMFQPGIVDQSLHGCRAFQDLTDNYLILLHISEGLSKKGYFCADDNRELRPLVLKLCDEYQGSRHGRLQMLRCLLIELIITFLRNLTDHLAPKHYHKTTEYILEYVEKNYMEPISLTTLADELHFSLPYVSKCFRQDTGQVFTRYLCSFRLRQSCRLLANTDYKIFEVAMLCGFNDIKYYNQKFKAAFELTPKQYREEKNTKTA